jgi:hypothetical protein
MTMNINAVLAAALALSTAGAQADLVNPNTGNSSVVFVAFNPVDQMNLTIDLGLSMSDLVRGGPLVNTPITWNFATNAVVGQNIPGAWSTAYNTFAAATSANEFTWAVFAGDSVSSGTAGAVIPSQGWIATGNATVTQMAAATTNGNTGPGLTAMANYFADARNSGNLLTAENGAGITTAGTSYGALGGNLLGRSTWNYLVANGVTSTVQQLVAATNPAVYQIGAGLSADATLNPNPLTFTFDIESNQLIMAAVPEPGTYALMLAGIASLGFIARRRRG